MKRLSALFIFLSFVVSAQNTQPRFDNSDSFISLPTGQGFTIITNSKVYFTEDAVTFSERQHDFNLDITDFLRFPEKNNIFLHRGGGLVYQYVNDSLIRLDNSYKWRSRYTATPLNKNDTIMLIGGRGEFVDAKNIVYYDENIKEWYLYNTKTSEFPKMMFAHYDESENKLMGLGDVIGDPETFNYYEFDLEDGSQKTFALEFSYPMYNVGYTPWIYPSSTPLLFTNSNDIIRWNFDNQTYTIFNYEYEIIRAKQIVDYNPVSKKFLIYDKDNYKLWSLDEDLLFSQPIKTVSFQLAQKTNNNNYLIISLIIILFGLLFLIFLRRRSVAKVVLSKKEEILAELSEAEAIIFTKIVESHPKPIELTELQQDFELQLTYESRLKKLRKCLNSIENLAREKASVSKSKEVFIHSQSREDKRIKLIRLNQH